MQIIDCTETRRKEYVEKKERERKEILLILYEGMHIGMM